MRAEPLMRKGGSGGRIVRTTGMVGRNSELGRIGDFVDGLVRHGGALVVTGEPGVGKTALLAAAAEDAQAAKIDVVCAAAVELESELPFSALHQLLLPLREDFDRLPAADREALTVALGISDGGAPDRRAVAGAVLALIRQATATRPLLMIVDDLP